MRKKTATRTQTHQKASSSQKRGLIVREKNVTQSAKTESALDNRFHRTDLPISCGVIIFQLENADRETNVTRLTTRRPSLFRRARRQLHGLVMQPLPYAFRDYPWVTHGFLLAPPGEPQFPAARHPAP